MTRVVAVVMEREGKIKVARVVAVEEGERKTMARRKVRGVTATVTR